MPPTHLLEADVSFPDVVWKVEFCEEAVAAKNAGEFFISHTSKKFDEPVLILREVGFDVWKACLRIGTAFRKMSAPSAVIHSPAPPQRIVHF